MKQFKMPSEQDRKNAWYRSLDYKRFHRENADALEQALDDSSRGMIDSQSLLSSTYSDNDETALLGLEYFFPEHTAARSKRRQVAWNLVIEMQDEINPNHLSVYYASASAIARMEACRKATVLQTVLWTPETS